MLKYSDESVSRPARDDLDARVGDRWVLTGCRQQRLADLVVFLHVLLGLELTGSTTRSASSCRSSPRAPTSSTRCSPLRHPPDPSHGEVSEGDQLDVTVNVSQVGGDGCTPLADALVDVWHCDALGVYSDVTDARNLPARSSSAATR